MDKPTFDLLVWIWTVIALIIFLVLLFVTAPYGRHSNKNWGINHPRQDRMVHHGSPGPDSFPFFYFYRNC